MDVPLLINIGFLITVGLVSISTAVVTLVFWVGYAIGKHRGLQEWERASR